MATIYSPNIVTNGLQLCLDAKNVRSYPGSGTSWYDLSGNGRTGTLTSVDMGSGYAVFNAQSDAVSFSTSFIIANEKTLSFWIKTDRPLSQQDNWEIGFLNQGSTQGSMFGMMFGVGQTEDLGYWGYGADYDFSITSPTTRWIDLNTWVHVTCTMDSSRNVRIYKNGVQQTLYKNSNGATASSFAMPIDTTNYFLINSRDVWNSGLTYIHLDHVLVYNRQLTDIEINQNYNALRDRFTV